ncbi:hypothetical protein T552_00653 [Pneumocystis carinii B80]|uniref:Uncharacterized protein n=1 Tax=Pneumocystis carinii (strain B80) TaxID=1408658 RepID=A0A0W4ZP89_PNEC8|nr:hypothetical protein T552_00653 [Pneumocystis carinii B80]KTW30176.1 hypothetical protein T552_00653 [Pneumocystis carinii B80]
MANRSRHVESVDDEKALQIQALQSAIWYTTGHITDSESLELGVIPSSHFIASLSTLVYSQINTLGEDIESFAKHRGGKVINVDDVLLCTRRNEGLHELMVEYAKQTTSTSEPKPKGKQKENIREAVKQNAKPPASRI